MSWNMKYVKMTENEHKHDQIATVIIAIVSGSIIIVSVNVTYATTSERMGNSTDNYSLLK